jgi:branched-chain amino acid transport system substrate-binding protein
VNWAGATSPDVVDQVACAAHRGRRTRAATTIAVAASVLAVSTACSGGSDDAGPATTASPTTSTVVQRPSDGVLRIGVLRAPADSGLRDSTIGAVDVAADRINERGGVLGRPVEVIEVDEGTTAAAASSAVEQLLDEDVDAIVGPMSSTTALSVLDRIASAGVVACSPTATAMALDEFPDDDLFFRTIPSDSLQAVAIAQTVEQTGVADAVILHVDDAYGRPLADAVEQSLDGIDVDAVIGFPPGDDRDAIEDAAAAALATDARVAVVLGAASETAQVLAALDGLGTQTLSNVVVNAPIRSAVASPNLASLSSSIRRKLIGVAPQAEAGPDEDEFDPAGPYAVNAFDCVNLIALAAVQASSDDPLAIAGQMASVSASGSVCRTFEQCAAGLADDRQIDYNGPSGITELRVRGDPSRARFDQFSIDPSGMSVWESSFVVET